MPKKIVVVKNCGMGDSIMGLGTVSYIRSLFPDAQIAYAIPRWLVPLYREVQIEASEIWGIDLKSPQNILSLWRRLYCFKPDLVFEMAQRSSSERFFKAWKFIHKRPYYFHNHHLEDGPVHDQGNVHKSVIQRDLDGAWSFLAREHNLPLPQCQDFSPEIILNPSPKKEKLIIFGVVATRKTKMWDLKKYVSLALEIRKNYPEYRISIPICNSKLDVWIEKQLRALKLPNGVFISKIPLPQLPSHLAKAILYVGNDTGLKHLAAALKVKSYTFFGPEPPLEWHPYDPVDHPYFYLEDLDCRFVKAHFCSLSTCDHMSCLNHFGVKETFEKIQVNLQNNIRL